MKAHIRIASCVVAALTLSGCQSFVSELGFGPKPGANSEQRAEVFGSDELERGRLALEQGNVATAIQLFRLAALNEKTAADAFNGLGVSYARLGRADLAERYFKAALELDSSNPKYAANLARFYQSSLGSSPQALAMRQREADEALKRAEIAAISQGLTGPLSAGDMAASDVVAPAAPSVARSSNREIQVSSSSATNATAPQPRVTVGQSQQAAAPARSRITLVGNTAPAKAATNPANGPVRITISRGGGGRWASRPRIASYPIRVALKRQD
ncbi:tetratricopeptide repeat protein [Altererythrobacter sp. BO-6]|uniref:tetratricopeptide repeat protein n=1 Tax=Altererythrobacter sp. BO-6 TaxID=2604537 RepID=UPI0013E1ADB2|nr:tetratricopeptide repeat protein [Altererythrobacter sp. BO-6]QIG55098.1 tetratricopeptide repeat protein [Altererythrobacter sp. BO-6]